MIIGILSDLHLRPQEELPRPHFAGDVMILAGDICAGKGGIEWALATFDCDVLYVPGNHEYYNHNVSTLDAELSDLCAGTRVRVLQNNVVVLNGVRFVGCTLWTDFDLYGTQRESAEAAGRKINDFAVIGHGTLLLTPPQRLTLHRRSRAFLEEVLAQPFDGRTVVITHHAPSARSVAPRFQGDALATAYVSNLDGLVERSSADLWVHGHVHDSFDYTIGNTRVLCNAKGRHGEDMERESPPFRWNYTVEL